LHWPAHYICFPAMHKPLVLGVVGWSGAGKTTLLKKLLPLLVARGLRVTTIKHAHHEFDVDVPGKDSYEHRKAGASEVIVCSARRWVQMHELGADAEPSLAQLLRKVSPCDLILVEGFKRERHPKLEIYRAALGKPLLFPEDPKISAIATDGVLAGAAVPAVDLNDAVAVMDVVLAQAQPLDAVLALLETSA
jgi:molybdopterin-guanine dinucleotide biosynthesis adapter protein